MGADHSITLLNQMLWLVLTIAAPVVAAVMIVGLIISILQVATQLQEMTLTFVPKIIAVFAALLAVMPYMGRNLSAFMLRISERIISGG